MGITFSLSRASLCSKQLIFSFISHLYSVYHHQNIQHQPLPRSIILILARLMLVGMVSTNPYCHMVEKVVFENQCEPYTEQTCWTQNQEECKPAMYKNCTGVIETKIERVCFDVNELVCDLVEAIHYETLEETYQVQRCFTGKDRVCDTTY